MSNSCDKLIGDANQSSREVLSGELLEKVKQVTPTFLEELVVDLFF